MSKLRFWLPALASIPLTPILLLFGVLSAGAGHGDYMLARILFPYTMLSTLFFGSITAPFLVLAVLQFPIYGLLVSFFGEKRWLLTIAVVAAVHAVMVIACFILPSENF